MHEIVIKAKRVIIEQLGESFVVLVYRPSPLTKNELAKFEAIKEPVTIDIDDETGEWVAGSKWLIDTYKRSDDGEAVTIVMRRNVY